MSEQWKPIESAPKDGTRIVVWLRRPAHFAPPALADIAYWTDHNGGGWVYYQNGDPTHWMPAAPPGAEQEPEPGELIVESSCPCCGAELRVEYGDDEGQIGVVGQRRDGQSQHGWASPLLGGGCEFTVARAFDNQVRATLLLHPEPKPRP